ncbi:MAG: DoxX family protein [Candidatus Eremiobacteraeota bacterium]|nr:DoxX family protein [Candidatus Eremiobacteraeota bacterium]
MKSAARLQNSAAWIVAIVLCFDFLGSAFRELTGQAAMVAEFESLGLSRWFMHLTGVVELVAAILVVIPRYSRPGAVLMAGVTVAAIYAHVSSGRAQTVGALVALLFLALVELWLRAAFRAPVVIAEG